MAWSLPGYEQGITRKSSAITNNITVARMWALDLFRLSIGEVGLGRMLESLMPRADGKGSPLGLPPGWMPPLVLPAVQVPREPTSAELELQEREREKRPGAKALDESLAQMTDEQIGRAHV